jgi:hypothetical protein
VNCTACGKASKVATCLSAALQQLRTMDRVAEPPPAFASTTSVPAFWIRCSRAVCSWLLSLYNTGGRDCDKIGRIVVPAWPPITGTLTCTNFLSAAEFDIILGAENCRGEISPDYQNSSVFTDYNALWGTQVQQLHNTWSAQQIHSLKQEPVLCVVVVVVNSILVHVREFCYVKAVEMCLSTGSVNRK